MPQYRYCGITVRAGIDAADQIHHLDETSCSRKLAACGLRMPWWQMQTTGRSPSIRIPLGEFAERYVDRIFQPAQRELPAFAHVEVLGFPAVRAAR